MALFVGNTGVFYNATTYLSLAILMLMKLDLLHVRYKEKTGLAELLVFSLEKQEKEKKNNLPALTQTKCINTGQISALCFYNFVVHISHLASHIVLVILAYMNYKGHILGTFKNAETFC